MKLYRLDDECMSTDIMRRHGFTCLNPDRGLVTAQIWEQDGRRYKFTGWEETPNTALMAANPRYITVEEINPV